MKVVHVTGGLGKSGAGVRETILELSRAQADLGAEVRVIGLDGPTFAQDAADWQGIPVKPVPVVGPARFGYAPTMTREIAAADPELVHLHGLWMHHGRSALQWARRRRRPYVLSPHGMLAPAALDYSRHRKTLVSIWFQRQVLASAAALHATSAMEEAHIRAYGLTNPVLRFGNGVPVRPERSATMVQSDLRTILYLGRLHPIKGLDQLVAAWSGLETTFPGWQLVIAGPDSGNYGNKLAALARQNGASRILFRGPAYGADKTALIAEADIFVLPSRSENFGITIAESLMASVPVVTTTGTPWGEVAPRGCGLVIPYGAEPLRAAMQTMMMRTPEERVEMGRRGRDWMVKEFTWAAIAKQALAGYDAVLSTRPQSPKPT